MKQIEMVSIGGVLAARDEYRAKNWTIHIQECSGSGLTKRELCQQRGISEKSFYYWLRRVVPSIVGKSIEVSGRNLLPGAAQLPLVALQLTFIPMYFFRPPGFRLHDPVNSTIFPQAFHALAALFPVEVMYAPP